jgi:enoyl-CoA hydratase/carnithine racemase
MNATKENAQIRFTRPSTAYWRVTFDNPPLNVMGPQFVRELREIITAVDMPRLFRTCRCWHLRHRAHYL